MMQFLANFINGCMLEGRVIQNGQGSKLRF